jgi:hypothetical protein
MGGKNNEIIRKEGRKGGTERKRKKNGKKETKCASRFTD